MLVAVDCVIQLDRYAGCVGGCDDNLRELLDLKDLTRLTSGSGKSSILTMFLLFMNGTIVSPDLWKFRVVIFLLCVTMSEIQKHRECLKFNNKCSEDSSGWAHSAIFLLAFYTLYAVFKLENHCISHLLVMEGFVHLLLL